MCLKEEERMTGRTVVSWPNGVNVKDEKGKEGRVQQKHDHGKTQGELLAGEQLEKAQMEH